MKIRRPDVMKKLRNVSVLIIMFVTTSVCVADEIYKTIDKDGTVSFSSIAPHDSKIVQVVSVKKLIKKISVIKGAAAQNKKIVAITKKLTESRRKRATKRQEKTENYNKEISLIKNQRLEGLKNLTDGKTAINTSVNNKDQLKQSLQRLIEQQE